MKKILFAVVTVAAASFIQVAKQDLQMLGAYKMLSQSVNNGSKDSAMTGINQLKIYTPDFMMYANVSSANSSSSFGVGTYTTNAGKVTENIIYTASDTTNRSQPTSYILSITKTSNGYKQFIPVIGEIAGVKYSLTELYERLPSSAPSPLDGVWKLVKSYTVNGKDTAMRSLTQFKTYHAGHFIWGQTFKDSTNTNKTAVGFGSFKMNGSNKLAETVMESSYSEIKGQTIDVEFKLKGRDEYQQSIRYSPAITSTEVYEHVKK